MPTKKPAVQQFMLLPTRGLQARQPNSSSDVRSALRFLTERLRNPKLAAPAGVQFPLAGMRILDSIHEDGAKLVEMLPETGDPSTRPPKPPSRTPGTPAAS